MILAIGEFIGHVVFVLGVLVVVAVIGFSLCVCIDLWQYAKLGTRRPDDGERE